MLDFVLEDAVSNQNDQTDPLDLIMVSGDFVMHDLAAYPGQETHWPLMREIIIKAITKLTEAFPGVPILSGFGNNDVVYHDSVPKADERHEFYADVFDILFANVTAN